MNFPGSIPFYRSAGIKIAAWIFAVFGLFAVALNHLLDDALNVIATQLVAAQVAAEVGSYGSSLSPHLAFEQQAGAEKILSRMVESSNGAISRAVIVDAEGEPFAAWGKGDLRPLYDAADAEQTSDGSRIAVAALTLSNGPRVGTLVAEWTVQHVAAPLNDARHRIILATMAFGLLIVASVLFVFRLLISRPLSRLCAAVECLRRHEYHVAPPGVARNDEIGVLSHSIDSLRGDLDASVEQEARARHTTAAFEAASLPLMVADATGIIRAINPAAQHLMTRYRDEMMKMMPAFDPANIVGQPLQQIHPNSQSQVLSWSETSPTSVSLKFGDGRVKLKTTPVHGADGSMVRLVLEWQDATDQFRNSARLDAIERTQFYAEFGADGRLKACNDMFRNATDNRSERADELLCSADPGGPTGHQMVEQALRGERTDGLFQISSSSGRAVFAEGSINGVIDTDNTIYRLFFFARDVTETHLDVEQTRIEREQSDKERRQVISALRTGMNKLANGNLDAEIEARFADHYEELRRDYNDTARTLQAAMMEVAEQASRFRKQTSEISAIIKTLTRRSENTASTLEHSTAALNHLTDGVRTAAENAQQASLLVSDARTGAAKSGEIVLRTVKAMDEIAASSEKVASITKVIDDIAFQTNLLALNAGVEAARAGDAGRGFAVVASEVRALAQRSSDAAREINTLIDQSSVQVRSGVTLVGETGLALQKIAGWVESISDRFVQIADCSKDQSFSLGEVNGAMNEVEGATRNVVARLEEAHAASQALEADACSLVSAISNFYIQGDERAEISAVPPYITRGKRLNDRKGAPFASSVTTPAETWTDF
ncbi:methyl-accepting chemotaxis protein [Palleronia sp.]|uniref:methyl-accepting chemotaxis protein n=1 Tax=Palleronia sp. TaxID=1940284 RepID=UPI0035C84163